MWQGEWSEEEVALFVKARLECGQCTSIAAGADVSPAFPQVAMEHGCGDKWGLFASYIPHRVGYQCSAAYRHIIIPRVRSPARCCSWLARSRGGIRRACCATTTSS